MTIVTTFYNALTTKLAEIWPDARHIANAFQLDRAASALLSDGYAIAIGASQTEPLDLSCQERFTRDILIMRTRVLVATENTTIATSVKTLLEDHYALRRGLRLDNTLGGVVSDIGFVSDGGIELLPTQTGAGNYHVLSSLFSVTYIENMN